MALLIAILLLHHGGYPLIAYISVISFWALCVVIRRSKIFDEKN